MASTIGTMLAAPQINTLRVPVEVFLMILSLLTFEELFNARLVCTEWRNMIYNDSNLRRFLFLDSASTAPLPPTLYLEPFCTIWTKFVNVSNRNRLPCIHPLLVNGLSAAEFRRLGVTLQLPGPLAWICPVPDLQPILDLYHHSWRYMYVSQTPVTKAFLVVRGKSPDTGAQYTLIENQTGVTLYDLANAVYQSLMCDIDFSEQMLDRHAYSNAFGEKESFGVFLIHAGINVDNLEAYQTVMDEDGASQDSTSQSYLGTKS